jgi:hypothetical protein
VKHNFLPKSLTVAADERKDADKKRIEMITNERNYTKHSPPHESIPHLRYLSAAKISLSTETLNKKITKLLQRHPQVTKLRFSFLFSAYGKTSMLLSSNVHCNFWIQINFL